MHSALVDIKGEISAVKPLSTEHSEGAEQLKNAATLFNLPP